MELLQISFPHLTQWLNYNNIKIQPTAKQNISENNNCLVKKMLRTLGMMSWAISIDRWNAASPSSFWPTTSLTRPRPWASAPSNTLPVNINSFATDTPTSLGSRCVPPYHTTQQNYRVREKSRPLKFFTVFSATVWDFNLKFYTFI